MRAAGVIIACLLPLTVPATADAVDPAGPVPGHGGLTYVDLMRQVVTDLDAATPPGEAEAHQIVPYRHIEGDNAKTDPAGLVAIKFLEPLQIHADGKPRLALLADLGESDGAVAEFVLLALFDLTDTPKLLDVVEVGTDRLTGFGDAPLHPLGRGSDLIRIDSDHFNSDEDFVDTELIAVRDGRFRLVDAIFTFDQKSCTFQRLFEPVVNTRRDPGRRYHRILLDVRETVKLEADRAECSGEKIPRPFVRTFHAIYRWNARRQKFVKTSGDLEKLAREVDNLNSPKR